MKRLVFLFFCAALIYACGSKETVATPDVPPPPPAPLTLEEVLEKADSVMLSTEFGDVTIKLYRETPKHRENFLKLIYEGYYEDLLFHRVINYFMVQGGDPNSKDAESGARLGSGGPGYTVPAEFDKRFIHKKGALAAARNNNPAKASSGSQFYIVQGKQLSEKVINSTEKKIASANEGFAYTAEQRAEYLANGGTPFLDMNYTVFGEVTSGIEVIEEIAKQPTANGDRPVTDIKMSFKILL